jgi:hypothetical protein
MSPYWGDSFGQHCGNLKVIPTYSKLKMPKVPKLPKNIEYCRSYLERLAVSKSKIRIIENLNIYFFGIWFFYPISKMSLMGAPISKFPKLEKKYEYT